MLRALMMSMRLRKTLRDAVRSAERGEPSGWAEYRPCLVVALCRKKTGSLGPIVDETVIARACEVGSSVGDTFVKVASIPLPLLLMTGSDTSEVKKQITRLSKLLGSGAPVLRFIGGIWDVQLGQIGSGSHAVLAYKGQYCDSLLRASVLLPDDRNWANAPLSKAMEATTEQGVAVGGENYLPAA